jgi:putative ABC transport system permease protein
MATLLQDLRHGARMLAKQPGFTAAMLLTLMLGVGANSAVFSIVNAVLLRPLPYADPDRLVRLWSHFSHLPQAGASEPEFLDYRARARSFASLAAFVGADATLTGGDEPEQVRCVYTSWELMPTLGKKAALGRVFAKEDDQPGSPPAVLLSHGLWRRRFGSDPNVVGTRVSVNGVPRAVVGVMPRGFDYPGGVDLWMPLGLDSAHLSPRFVHYLDLVGRLQPGVSVARMQAEMDNLADQLRKENDYGAGTHWGVDVVSMLEQEVGPVRPALLVVLGAVALVLLIACVNVANMLLVRMQARSRELSLRAVLGAGRGRLVRQFLAESLLLALPGGALGLLLAWAAIRAFVFLYPDYPRVDEVALDGRVLAFTFAIAVLTGLVVALLPAWKASRPDLAQSIKESGGKATASRAAQGPRQLLVVLEVALALVLLAGASLMVESFLRMRRVDPGFRPQRTLTMQLALPRSKYAEPPAVASFYAELLRRVRGLPGVQAAAFISHLPLSGGTGFSQSISVEGRPFVPGAPTHEPNLQSISPDYFRALGIRLVRGRTFNDSDVASGVAVVIVDRTLADTLWPDGGDPVGKRLTLGIPEPTSAWLTIAGIVEPVKSTGLKNDPRGELYFPQAQRPERSGFLVVRAAAGDPKALAPGIRAQIKALDRDQPVKDVQTMEERLSRSLSKPRFSTLLLALFAVLAMLLAAIGIYGVVAFSVAQRTNEIGIRMALGARRGQILQRVVGEGMVLALLGVAVGLVAALWFTRLLASLLFGVAATDPATFAGVALLLATVALLASLLPARRASRLEPTTALRYE